MLANSMTGLISSLQQGKLAIVKIAGCLTEFETSTVCRSIFTVHGFHEKIKCKRTDFPFEIHVKDTS